MKNSLLFVMLFTSFLTLAQDFEVPKNYSLKETKDYVTYQNNVVACVNWLEQNPVDQNESKRMEAKAFLMQWITGSPTVTIEMSSYILNLTEKNSELLMTFLGGWTKHAIENPETISVFSGNLEGVKSVLKVYQTNKEHGFKKDKNIEKLLKLDTEQDLTQWLEKQLKS